MLLFLSLLWSLLLLAEAGLVPDVGEMPVMPRAVTLEAEFAMVVRVVLEKTGAGDDAASLIDLRRLVGA